MNSIHWEELDNHLRSINTPWSIGEAVPIKTLFNELFLRQSGRFPDYQLYNSLMEPLAEPASKLLKLVLWILTQPIFYLSGEWTRGFWNLLEKVGVLASYVAPGLFLKDPERREELVRLVMSGMNVGVEGETPEKGLERSVTLDSVARAKILQETRAAQARAQAIREALAKQQAEEAASKYNRE